MSDRFHLPASDLEALAAQVVIPVLDLRGDDAAQAESWRVAGELAEAGVGGFLLFGGRLPELPGQLAALSARAPVPLLICADLERGLGQQVAGGFTTFADKGDVKILRREGSGIVEYRGSSTSGLRATTRGRIGSPRDQRISSIRR